tara:strand:+ start:233 stop:952 length:720 start_codon:yes stop_codon:yes gene_type:complete
MKYVAYTSMDEKYYNHCGKPMLLSYKQHWSKLMPLHVYNEDNFNVKVKTITPVGWKLGDDYDNFMARHSNDKVKTFAKKGFTVIHAMENIQADRIIWLDADTLITEDIPLQLLDLISPEDTLSTHFSVWHIKDDIEYHSCETGFFILNQNHLGYKEFCETYKDIYVNDKTEGMRRFYDGEIYGRTVDIMAAKGHKMLNLNPGRHKTPISRSVIAPYISHFKADLKNNIDYTRYQLEDEI